MEKHRLNPKVIMAYNVKNIIVQWFSDESESNNNSKITLTMKDVSFRGLSMYFTQPTVQS